MAYLQTLRLDKDKPSNLICPEHQWQIKKFITLLSTANIFTKLFFVSNALN